MKELVVSKNVFVTDDFSQAMKVGDLLYKNIESILKEAGAVLDDVIKFTVYLKDINNLGKFRELRNQFFSAPRPPSTAVEVTGLVPGAIVEVEVIVDCGKR